MKRPDLILFAKQPRLGEAKTRLAQACGAERAAEIATVLIRESVVLAASSWPGEVYLCCAPDTDHPLFAALAAELHVSLVDQGGGDLGERMLRSLRAGISRSGVAAIMGCDVPHCLAFTLEQAYEALARGRNVLGSTLDGGYYFIGLQQVESSIFTGMEWGGDQVLAQTIMRAGEAGIRFEMLAQLRDIDTWEDLVSVAQQFPPLQPFVTNSLRSAFRISTDA